MGGRTDAVERGSIVSVAARRKRDGSSRSDCHVRAETEEDRQGADSAGEGVQNQLMRWCEMAYADESQNTGEPQGQYGPPRLFEAELHDQLVWMNGDGPGVEPTMVLE